MIEETRAHTASWKDNSVIAHGGVDYRFSDRRGISDRLDSSTRRRRT